MKTFLTVVAVAVGVAIGVAAIVYGESDDSPGLQLIGVLLVAGAVTLSVRTVRRSR